MPLSENAKTIFKIIQDALLEDPTTSINKALLHAMQVHLHVTDEEMLHIEHMFLEGAVNELRKHLPDPSSQQNYPASVTLEIISKHLEELEKGT